MKNETIAVTAKRAELSVKVAAIIAALSVSSFSVWVVFFH